MLEFLKELFGTTKDGQAEALTLAQLEEKIAAAGDKFKIVNIADGGFISKEKYDKKDLELKGVKDQLAEANTTIQSYRDMDIDGIKKSAADWQAKYEADTKTLQEKLTAQETEFAAKTYLGGFKYANDLVRDAIYAKFMAKNFVREGDKFLGADDFMAEMKKQYPSGFVSDEPAPKPEPESTPAPTPAQNPVPYFSPQKPSVPSGKKRSLQEIMQHHNEHPNEPINFD